MKRHPALQDLSRDHFHVLFRCQRFRRALKAAEWSELKALVEEFIVFYESDMSSHFREEDEIVVPAAGNHTELRAVADRTLEEHRELRGHIEALRGAREDEAACRELLKKLEPLITAHVEMEERELFEGLQAVASETEMSFLGNASLRFRQQHRAPDSIGPRRGRG